MSWATRLLAVLALLLAFGPARADELKPGYLELTQTAPLDWKLTWKAPQKAGLIGVASPKLPDDCTFKETRRAMDGVALRSEGEVHCKKPLAGRAIGLAGLENTISDVLVRVAPMGEPVQASRLTPTDTMTEVKARADAWNVARTYLALGVQHILTGYDHLLFVVSLVLLLRGGWRIIKTVTAFTLAHSITLAGAALGYFSLPQAPVESVIALSIIFLAVEIAKARPGQFRLSEQYPWAVSFSFGLLHGFGFAGALKEIGLPHGEVPAALLSFNIGVEIGQLVIVGCAVTAVTLIGWIAPSRLRPATLTAAYVIGALASGWFINRTLAS